MNKKILIIGGIIALGFIFKNKIFGASVNTTPTKPQELPFLQANEGKILVSSAGQWFTIKNGIIYIFTDEPALRRYQQDNPAIAEPVYLNFDAWGEYAASQDGGVTQLLGY